MADIKKTANQSAPYEAFARAEKRPACQPCLVQGRVVPHNPPSLVNCPSCGTPFLGVSQIEEVSDITVTKIKPLLRQRVATWLMNRTKTNS